MKKILATLLLVLGILAICLVIWFVGPMVSIGEFAPLATRMARWVLIGLIAGTYLAWKLWKVIAARRKNKAMMNDLLVSSAKSAAPAEPSASQQEVAELKRRFEEAVKVFRDMQLNVAGRKGGGLASLFSLSGKQYLYQLPWYVFIGAPGSGKTTALVNSGLQFPLAEKFGTASIKGIGGTRNCDWWFTDEAVLLDTAGRYTTQESDRNVDAAAWQGFLDLLKRFRPRRPINGIILTISAGDLLQQSPAEREMHAQAVRTRIQELHERFKIAFPIYVLVTKTDLLAGFMEFFGDLGRDERAQVWGTTFPYVENQSTDASLATLATELEALQRRIVDRIPDRLQAERDPGRRAAIFGFQQQFAGVRPALGAFLERVFAVSKYEQPPMLRGVYFTSGTQEGSPIDRVLGGLSRALGIDRRMLPPQASSGRSYFLTGLLKNVVFFERALAGTNLKWERRRNLVQWGAYAIAALVTAGLVSLWAVSYSRNQGYLEEVTTQTQAAEQQVAELPPQLSSDVVPLLPILERVRSVAETPAVGAGRAPTMMGFGLYQGDKLGSAARTAYDRLLTDAFLPRLALRIEEQVRQADPSNLEYTYEALKAYLMINEAGPFDVDALRAWIRLDWQRTLPREVTEQERSNLVAHLDNLLALGTPRSPVPPDQALIAQTRQTLARYPLADRVYSRLKRQGVGENFAEFTIARAGGAAAPLVFERKSGDPLTSGVAGMYSYDAYHTAFVSAADKVSKQMASENGWVLGLVEPEKGVAAQAAAVLDDGSRQLAQDVRRLYLEDYANTWEHFVNDIRLKRSSNLQESMQLARILSAVDSPLVPLLEGIARETTLSEKREDEKTIVDRTTEKFSSATEDLVKILGGGGDDKRRVVRNDLEKSIVDDRFAAIRRMVYAPPGGKPPIDGTLQLINDVYTLLAATDTAIKSGNAPPQSEVPNRVKADASRLPQPVRGILQTLSATSASQALGATRRNLSQGVGSQVGDFCRQAIAGRYPFVKSSNRDVTQDDFARLFAPGGIFDDFFQRELAQYVDTSTRSWSFKKVNDQSMGGSGNLVQFQNAATIRDVFFRGGGRTPNLRLDFKPIEMDAAITQFILDVDGQLVKYSHGPQVPQSVQWPGPRGSTQVRVSITPPAPNGTSGVVTEGPWALFRLLDRATIESTSLPERFRVTLSVAGRNAVFEVTANSVQNPFRLNAIERFSCPSGL